MNIIIKVGFLFILCIMLNGCSLFPKNCKDVVHRNITEQELDFFPDYVEDDTVYYTDLISGNIYHAACVASRVDLRRRGFSDDHKCAGGGYYSVVDVVEIIFYTDIPYTNPIAISYFSREGFNLVIVLSGQIPLSYDYITNKINKLQPDGDIETDFYEKLKINNIEYYDVHLITSNSFSNFDSIFYNSEYGFLRFASKNKNLDMVLDR